MIASIAGTVKHLKEGLTSMVEVVTSAPSTDSVAQNESFRDKKFPTGIRFLYLRSSENQNKVVTIGYYYESPEIVKYQVARCMGEKNYWIDKVWGELRVNKPDIFSRRIGRAIVTGRMEKFGPKVMNVASRDDMYNKFICVYHPDRSERRKAKQALVLSSLYEENNNKTF